MALFAKILKKIFHHPCLKYRRIAQYGMSNAIHYKCEFACDSKPAGLPVTANPKGVSWRILGKGDHKT